MVSFDSVRAEAVACLSPVVSPLASFRDSAISTISNNIPPAVTEQYAQVATFVKSFEFPELPEYMAAGIDYAAHTGTPIVLGAYAGAKAMDGLGSLSKGKVGEFVKKEIQATLLGASALYLAADEDVIAYSVTVAAGSAFMKLLLSCCCGPKTRSVENLSTKEAEKKTN
jgi:hypothetical protein